MTKIKNGKVLLVSYNQVEGFPAGKYEDKKLIILSAHSGGQLLGGNWVEDGSIYYGDRFNVANARLEGIAKTISTINSSKITEAVVYVGQRAVRGALNLAKSLSSQGKKIRIVGCDCDYSEKARVAKELGVDYEMSECGGVKTMGRIARTYQNQRIQTN
jgi:hypothetical protein